MPPTRIEVSPFLPVVFFMIVRNVMVVKMIEFRIIREVFISIPKEIQNLAAGA